MLMSSVISENMIRSSPIQERAAALISHGRGVPPSVETTQVSQRAGGVTVV
jgi:hypothetical protein